jgi:hypothetical protein
MMNGDTKPEPAVGEAAAQDNRRNLAVATAGGLLLVIGAVVLAVGWSSASSASNDLGNARQRLSTQQSATRGALQCQRDLRAGLPKVIFSGQALLTTAGQITSQDQQAVQASHDGQAAGSQSRIDDYNATVTRNNAAGAASDGLAGTANQQSAAFRNDTQALLTACP